MKHLCVAIAVLCALNAQAQNMDILPNKIGLHAGSWHSKPGLNNINPGINAEWRNGLIAGVFYF
ncbi:MAG: hypothetical protein ACRCVX_12830 [Shewanella sp.]